MSKYCSGCGAVYSDNVKFCENCGTRLADSAAMVVDAEAEMVEAEVVDVVIERPRGYDSPAADAREVRERLIGTKQEYYLPRFEKMETLNSFTDWNWAACLFGAGWMMYRRMYMFGLLLWVVANVVTALEIGLLTLAFWIGCGLLGNYLYMKDINNRTDKALDLQPDERELYIQKNSGTSWTGVLVLFALGVFLQTIFG